MNKNLSEQVRIGQNAAIDDGVLLGYLTGRKIQSTELLIGDSAHVRSGSVIYAGTTIGNNLETGHGVVIREENQIGDNFKIWNNSTVDYGCRIGHDVRIHCNCYVAQFTTIEDGVFLAPGVTTTNDPHPICTKCMTGPTIRRGARICAGATILPHVTIGRFALVGAGSLVARDVPDYAVAFGVPARLRGKVTKLKCSRGIREHPYDYVEDEIAREQERK
ncbi:MAG: N-acetyltransferase [Planctomycetota bacterium]